MARTQTAQRIRANLRKLALPIAVAAITAGAANGFGGLSLTKIPTVGADTSNEGRCITVDGKYVGGLSGTANGFMYDVAKNNVIRPLAESYASIITGIAYRTDINQSPAKVQILVDGNNNGYMCQWETSNAGTNWGLKLVNNLYSLHAPPAGNSLAAKVGSDVFYWTYRTTDKIYVATSKASGLWDSVYVPTIDPEGLNVADPDRVYTTGVSATGRMVGYRLNGTTGTNVNNLWDWPPSVTTSFQWHGLDGTLAGEASAVNQEGTVIFGRSPITPGTPALYTYKTVVTAAPGPAQTSLHALPELPRTVSGAGITRGVAYGCTADGKYAVGYLFPHATLATLWDTSDANSANWKVTDLTALAAANGAGVPNVFSSLSKAYSVGTNATDLVITGFGTEAGTGNTRGFVMTVPKTMAAAGFSNKPKLAMSGSYPAGFTFGFYGEPGTTNHVEYTTNLAPPSPSWTAISSTAVVVGATITVSDSNLSGSQRFYRVRIDP